MAVEVRSRAGWRILDPELVAPAIGESELFVLRGLASGSTVEIGPERSVAATDGRAEISLRACESLRGHLGLIEVRIDGTRAGEIEVLPDKSSQSEYLRLRADLEAVWAGLVFDPHGVSRLQAQLPPADLLSRRIERPLRSIIDMPREVIAAGMGPRHLRSVRRASELTRSVVHHGVHHRPGLARIQLRSTDTPENVMVAATLRKLIAHARRTGDFETEARLDQALRLSHLGARGGPVTRISWGMRSDPAYRQVLDVYRILERPELGATEGPGELRLGVRGMIRLYEYWVFLQVLLAATDRYGDPLDQGFEVLARRLHGGRARLELPAGTTITFPGPVHVAFEPRITTGNDSWQEVEYVPHPNPERSSARSATPDVVVFHPGSPSWLMVIDAKYVARSWIERDAAILHEKYSRMKFDGRPVARYILAAHPHHGLENRWAGYGHVPMVPGRVRPILPLPAVRSRLETPV